MGNTRTNVIEAHDGEGSHVRAIGVCVCVASTSSSISGVISPTQALSHHRLPPDTQHANNAS